MPKEVMLSDGNIYTQYLYGEPVPSSISGEVSRHTVPLDASSSETRGASPKGALEVEGLNSAEQVAANRANTTDMNARMREVNAGFVPSERTFNRMIVGSIIGVVVVGSLLEYFDKLGPLIQ